VVLVPAAVFLAAMLFEGAGKDRWGKIRRATPKAIVSPPLSLPIRRQTRSIGAGGLAFAASALRGRNMNKTAADGAPSVAGAAGRHAWS
jgi:hypothetical protein